MEEVILDSYFLCSLKHCKIFNLWQSTQNHNLFHKSTSSFYITRKLLIIWKPDSKWSIYILFVKWNDSIKIFKPNNSISVIQFNVKFTSFNQELKFLLVCFPAGLWGACFPCLPGNLDCWRFIIVSHFNSGAAPSMTKTSFTPNCVRWEIRKNRFLKSK